MAGFPPPPGTILNLSFLSASVACACVFVHVCVCVCVCVCDWVGLRVLTWSLHCEKRKTGIFPSLFMCFVLIWCCTMFISVSSSTVCPLLIAPCRRPYLPSKVTLVGLYALTHTYHNQCSVVFIRHNADGGGESLYTTAALRETLCILFLCQKRSHA